MYIKGDILFLRVALFAKDGANGNEADSHQVLRPSFVAEVNRAREFYLWPFAAPLAISLTSRVTVHYVPTAQAKTL